MSERRAERHLVFLGPMGAGKTALGEAVAAIAGLPFFDSDHILERDHGCNARDLAATFGVSDLHRMELATFLTLLEASHPTLIAAAASVADHPTVLDDAVAAGHVLVYLDASGGAASGLPDPDLHRRPLSIREARTLAARRRRNAVAAGAVVFPIDRSRDTAESAVLLAARLGITRSSS